MVRQRVRAMVVVAAVALIAASCAGQRPRATPEPPALDPPPPPPRLIRPLDLQPETVEPEDSAKAPGAKRPPPRGEGAKTEQGARNDTVKRDTTAKTENVTETPPPPPPEPAKAGLLETTTRGSLGEVENKVKELINQATEDLTKRVDYGALNADGRTQYDTARRFVEQAQAALKDRNLVYAIKLADKAASLARSLVER